MASLDLSFDYESVKSKIAATSAYNDLKSQYTEASKKAGETFDTAKSDVTETLSQVKEQTKRFERQIKSQLEQLLDISNVSNGKGGNTLKYIKKTLLQTLKNIEPKVGELIFQEAISAIGCDQQQSYTPTDYYIKVKAIDLSGLLTKDPTSKEGKVLYEKNPISIQSTPFSMNRELYLRIQSGNSYYGDYTQNYKGTSGQDLFNIQYVETNNLGETGPWFKISLSNRYNGNYKVGGFLSDYYSSIKLIEFTNIIACIMESLTGVLSIQANIGLVQAEDASKFELLIQRILGLCFDNKTEIDVSGVAKVAELDGVDNSFFEFTEIDLRNIDLRVTNIKNGVIEFQECDTVKLPLDTVSILNALDNLNFVSDNQLVDEADSITDTLINNPEWNGLVLQGNVQAAINLNFIKLIVNGLVVALLSPKVLLPIFLMLKALGNTIVDQINSFMDFMKKFSKFAIELISKIGAIFVQELFEIIKKDIKNLIQQVILDIAKEKANKKIIIILKLIQLLLVVAQFISDWRRCKSVVDELLWLLKIITTGWGGEIPLPLLFASQLMDGYSESRAFIGAIEELQKIGVPTGPMPDGSPNIEILAQMKAMANEEAENGKIQVAIGPLAMTPAGVTVPASAFGKKF
jgi:hypothetical protein